MQPAHLNRRRELTIRGCTGCPKHEGGRGDLGLERAITIQPFICGALKPNRKSRNSRKTPLAQNLVHKI